MLLHAPHSAGQMAVTFESLIERLQLVRAINARHSVGSGCKHEDNVVGTALLVLMVLLVVLVAVVVVAMIVVRVVVVVAVVVVVSLVVVVVVTVVLVVVTGLKQ